MRGSLARRQTPEEAELARRRLQLSALRAKLIGREHALDELRAQLLSFEGRYIRQVGKLYKQLDEWEKKIAELDSPLLASSEEQDEEIAEALSADRQAMDDDPEDVGTNLDLRTLYREVARRIHPDFALDSSDALRRTRLMAQANEAFRRKDASMLRRMLLGHDASAPQETAAEELARVAKQIARTARDVTRLDAEIEALQHSDLAKLQERCVLAAGKGRDLLAEMAARVKGNIGMAMRRYELDLQRKKRGQAAFDPTSLLSADTTTRG